MINNTRKDTYNLEISQYNSNMSISESDYYKYVCCYNIIHELGHVLFRENSHQTQDVLSYRFEEECLVIQLAASYWREFGSDSFYDEINTIVKRQLLNSINYFGEAVGIELKDMLEVNETNKKYYTNWFRENAYVLYGRLAFDIVPENSNIRYRSYNLYQEYFNYMSLCENRSFFDIAEVIIGKEIEKSIVYAKNKYSYNKETPNKVIHDFMNIMNCLNVELPDIQYESVRDRGHNSVQKVCI